MKRTILAFGILSLAASVSQAAVAITPRPEEGIPYDWSITLGATGSDSVSGHVGAWSWDEDGFPLTARGWTHTSTWVMLTLTQATVLNLKLESKADVPWDSPSNPDPLGMAGANLRPSFTLYSGTDELSPQDHNFNNRGDIAWAGVSYVDHTDDSLAAPAMDSWSLPAGTYTVNLGGNSPAVIAEGRQGYLATFTTSPVPEPSSALFLGTIGCISLLRRNKRK